MEKHTVKVRHLKIEDYRELKSSMIEAYPEMKGEYWREHHIATLLEKFPDGQLCVEVDGKVVGSALSLIVDYSRFGDDHTYAQITADEKFTTHDAKGDVLYGIEVFIHPDFRGLRLARRLYDARRELCESFNLKSIVIGGRMPGYANLADKYKPKEYIDKVKRRELHDPVLTFQLSNDFHVKKALKNYLPGDKASCDYAILMEWHNIYYTTTNPVINTRKSVVRLGLVQWQMRTCPNLDKLLDQVEFFVDAVSDYQSDFVLFPEFFNAPLMADFNHLSEADAIRKLAQFTLPLRDRFAELAISYNVNIITGSMPVVENGKLFNKGYLCQRNGNLDDYEKLHITPAEISAWGMSGGTKLKAFDTDAGRVGILICYDVEFPELGRLLAEQGVDILFVPFLTDTQNGYMRVRSCAQARAIENECYVAIAGSVGNLPKVNNMDIQYAQSAVLTPSDFAFPTTQIKAEATPNSEMTLIADVDLDLLKQLHMFGSVRNLQDRRHDLYELKLKKQ